MYITETYTNPIENYIIGESDPYEVWQQSIGDLFRSLQQDHGRCTGKVYIDTNDEEVVPIGWVFQKRNSYDNLIETWVSLLKESEVAESGYEYCPIREWRNDSIN